MVTMHDKKKQIKLSACFSSSYRSMIRTCSGMCPYETKRRFGVIPRRLKYDAVADDATQGVYLYRQPGMAHVRILLHGILNSP